MELELELELNKESTLAEMSEARPTTCKLGPGLELVIDEEGRGSWTWRSKRDVDAVRSAIETEAETEADTEPGAGHLVSEVEPVEDPTVAVVQPVTEKKSASERTVAFSSINDE